MGVLSRRRERRAVSIGANDIVARATADRLGAASATYVTPESALQADGVWAAQTLVSSLGSFIPLNEIRERGEVRERLQLSSVFADPDPDPSIDALAFRSQILQSLASRGNAYATVLVDGSMRPVGMVSIHPESVVWKFDAGVWRTFVDGIERRRWPLGDLWHVPINLQAGSPIGMDPINYHRGTLAPSLAARKFGARFFDAGGLPIGFVELDGTVNDPGEGGAKELKQKIVTALDGSREPIVLPSGIRFREVQVNAEESQFLETQRFGVEQAARIYFGGFPEMIGGSPSGGSQTYANLEQRIQAFATLSLIPRYLAPLEQALSRLIPSGRKVVHNVNALSRGDLAARYQSYLASAQVQQMTGMPILTNDEIRALEDRPPLDRADFPAPTPAPGGGM